MNHKVEDDDEDELSGKPPLSVAERRILRKMMENEDRIQWFWGSVRVWAGWVSGAIIAAWSLVEIINTLWKRG